MYQFNKSKFLMLAIFIIALTATLGSLYFSEVKYYLPCKLCWYQRIMMYPIVILSFLGLWRSAKEAVISLLPLSVIGILIATFHLALQKRWFGLEASACSDALCAVIYVNYFGFITIPVMAFTAFLFIIALAVKILKI